EISQAQRAKILQDAFSALPNRRPSGDPNSYQYYQSLLNSLVVYAIPKIAQVAGKAYDPSAPANKPEVDQLVKSVASDLVGDPALGAAPDLANMLARAVAIRVSDAVTADAAKQGPAVTKDRQKEIKNEFITEAVGSLARPRSGDPSQA